MSPFSFDPSSSTPQVQAYVSPTVYQDGKDEQLCPRYHEDFAILDPSNGYTVLSARGIHLGEGRTPLFSEGEITFIEHHLPYNDALLVQTKDGVLLILRSFFSASGLLPVILPHGPAPTVAHVLKTVFADRLLCSPAVLSLPSGQKDFEPIYHRCTSLLELCDYVLRPVRNTDFRTHCAAIARLAGCKADVTSLPFGSFPLHEADHTRWTVFLLCTLLSLRGDSSLEVKLELIQANRQEFYLRLSHHSERKRKAPASDAILRLFSLPAFSDYRLTCSKSILTVETELRRSRSDNLLHSLTDLSQIILLRVEIV